MESGAIRCHRGPGGRSKPGRCRLPRICRTLQTQQAAGNWDLLFVMLIRKRHTDSSPAMSCSSEPFLQHSFFACRKELERVPFSSAHRQGQPFAQICINLSQGCLLQGLAEHTPHVANLFDLHLSAPSSQHSILWAGNRGCAQGHWRSRTGSFLVWNAF